MPRLVKGPDGITRSFPDDATDAEIASALGSSNTLPMTKAAPSGGDAPSNLSSLGLMAAGVAARPAADAVANFATSPDAWKTAKDLGSLVGLATGGYEGGLPGAAAGYWLGGKTGYRLANAGQKIAAPIASAMDKLAPYAQAASTLGGAQGVLDLAQMQEPNRKDIGFLGVGPTTGPSDPQHPPLVNALIQMLLQKVQGR
jgi:hypothetical protein